LVYVCFRGLKVWIYILDRGYRLGSGSALSAIALLLAGYATSLFMAWCIGANDASNPVETAVGAGLVSVKRALTLSRVAAIARALA